MGRLVRTIFVDHDPRNVAAVAGGCIEKIVALVGKEASILPSKARKLRAWGRHLRTFRIVAATQPIQDVDAPDPLRITARATPLREYDLVFALECFVVVLVPERNWYTTESVSKTLMDFVPFVDVGEDGAFASIPHDVPLLAMTTGEVVRCVESLLWTLVDERVTARTPLWRSACVELTKLLEVRAAHLVALESFETVVDRHEDRSLLYDDKARAYMRALKNETIEKAANYEDDARYDSDPDEEGGGGGGGAPKKRRRGVEGAGAGAGAGAETKRARPFDDSVDGEGTTKMGTGARFGMEMCLGLSWVTRETCESMGLAKTRVVFDGAQQSAIRGALRSLRGFLAERLVQNDHDALEVTYHRFCAASRMARESDLRNFRFKNPTLHRQDELSMLMRCKFDADLLKLRDVDADKFLGHGEWTAHDTMERRLFTDFALSYVFGSQFDGWTPQSAFTVDYWYDHPSPAGDGEAIAFRSKFLNQWMLVRSAKDYVEGPLLAFDSFAHLFVWFRLFGSELRPQGESGASVEGKMRALDFVLCPERERARLQAVDEEPSPFVVRV